MRRKRNGRGDLRDQFVERLIRTKLFEDIPPGMDLGIERAHRALGTRPPENATPRSILIKFLKFTTKEKVIHAAWKKPITFEGKRLSFDHDYATEVLSKRKEYTTIKKTLKEKGIRFQTPLTRMRVFLKDGTVTYHSAEQAAEDLRARGIAVPHTRLTKKTPDTLLLPWENVKDHRHRDPAKFQRSVREKLRGFQRRTGDEDTTPAGD